MNRNDWAIVAVFCALALLLVVFGKKKQWKRMLVAALIAQSISWLVSILCTYCGLTKSPYRLFPEASDGNFLLAFITHPVLVAIYCLYYPHNAPWLGRFGYTALLTAIAQLAAAALDHYTDLAHYVGLGSHVLLWVVLMIAYTLCMLYVQWFFRQLAARNGGAS